MEPHIHLNWVAIIVATVANFVLSALWYMPLFGKAWAKEMKMDMTAKPQTSVMVKGMVITLIGNFLMAFVLTHNIQAWNPITWGQPAGPMSPMAMASAAAFFTWLGFYVPQDLGRIAWEMSSWKLFFINTIYHYLSLLVAAIILIMM